MIASEATRYAGQTHPCYGVQPVGWQDTTRHMPWVFTGRTVWWGFACATHSDALAVAVDMASQISPEPLVGT